MARFRFSMENILSMKLKLEEQKKNEYSQTILQLRIAEEKLQHLLNRVEESKNTLKEEMRVRIDVQLIKRMEDGIEVLKMHSKIQELEVIEREKEVAAARELLNEAMKERKIFERLKEKALEEFLLEEKFREQKEVDELVSYRFGNISGGNYGKEKG